jgi:hypothetical protein
MTPEIEHDDESLLTAYALGELDGAERAHVAARMEADAAVRRYVEQIRATAGVVADGLALEQGDGLGLLHRELIERKLLQVSRRDGAAAAASSGRQQARRMRIGDWAPMAASLAASVAIVCGTVAYLLPRLNPQTPTASVPAHDHNANTGVAVLGPNDGVPEPTLADDRDPSDLAYQREAWQAVEGMMDPAEYEAEQQARRDEEQPADDAAAPADEPKQPDAAVAQGPSSPSPAPAAQPKPSPAESPKPDEPTKVARGPAESPEAEDVRAGRDKPKVDAPKAPKQPGGRRGVFVSPPRDPQLLDRVKQADAAQPRLFENPFRAVAQRPRSSFPVRVETGPTYRTVRTSLQEGTLPPPTRVRIEELVNRFAYHYPAPPEDGLPLAVSVEVATCPWDVGHRLARVAVKAREGGATVVARGVAVSLEFNAEATGAWRLIGYENAPAPRNQAVPTFDLTAGDTATALYEIIPAAGADLLPRIGAATVDPKVLFTVRLNFRDPQDGDAARELSATASDAGNGFDRASEDFRFTSAVAAFGMLLRDSQFKGTATHADVIRWATAGKGHDQTGERAAFIELAKAARDLTK